MHAVTIKQRENTNPSSAVAAAVADHLLIAIGATANTKQWTSMVTLFRKSGSAIIQCTNFMQGQYVCTKIRDADPAGVYEISVIEI